MSLDDFMVTISWNACCVCAHDNHIYHMTYSVEIFVERKYENENILARNPASASLHHHNN